MDLLDIKPLDIQALYESRDDGKRSGSWLNSERTWLGGFWRWARTMELVEHDPVQAWPRKRMVVQTPYVNIFEQEEEKLLPFLKERFARFLVFALVTGLRVGTIRVLVWGWLSEEWVLRIPAWAIKQRRELCMPLNSRVIKALGPRGKPGELLFPDLPTTGPLNRALKLAARKAGVSTAISPHQLRRSWVGRLHRAGTPMAIVKSIQGWASESIILKHYWGPVTESEARGYLERI